ncbi:MAG: cupin domain-containing protein [Burkholderiaceae bacterium]|nr:cupin domain-containing protein [Burkholderiaceae bacterium]
MRNTLATLSAALAFCTIAAPVAFAQSSGHAGMASDHMMATPDELKWVDIPSLPPGAKLAVIEGPLNQAGPITFRLKLPANYQIPAHWHPAIEHVTVISGTFNMGAGDKLDPTKTKALAAGGIAIMQPKTTHFAWNKEETIVQVHGMGPWGVTYVNPADDPRKK